MKLGIVGLPNVGKSTLFNAITKNMIPSENYPFCTIEPNVGVVAVPDERLAVLGKMYNTKKITPAIVEFVDIAGLVKGASAGEGLGNKFLSHIREVDAIVHVVRCFENSAITHVCNNVDPIRDIEIINLELVLSDLETVIKRQERVAKIAKSGNKEATLELELLKRLQAVLENGKPVRSYTATIQEQNLIKQMFLITSKPVIYCANISEEQISNASAKLPLVEVVKNQASLEDAEVIVICARIEEELASMPSDEAKLFINELGIKICGLEKLIKTGYNTLGLISFLTAGEKEVRAWTITSGTKAPQAAGKIHTDFERGFIKAEIIDYNQLVDAGSFVKAKELGKVAIVGKDYVMKDGDVALFRFNV